MQKVFEDTRPIIASYADGYNVCIIAYGQTGGGVGKTGLGGGLGHGKWPGKTGLPRTGASPIFME
uniref:Kinesin motor domain-containing protein n=1 Tax=Amphimedon queenslandica TaxID=400682 RepID=I1EZY3_AMPQE